MKIVIMTLFLSIFLSLSACGPAPVTYLSPTVVEHKGTETLSLSATATAAISKTPTETPVVIQVNTETPVLAPSANPEPVFKTAIGDLVIEKVQSVESVNGVSAGPDEKLILISLGKIGAAKLDPGNFPLDAFDKAMRNQPGGEVHISGDDGLFAVCSMAGWIAPDYKVFAMGFRVPNTAKKVQFFWPGNNPIDLVLND